MWRIFNVPKNLSSDFDGYGFVGTINLETWDLLDGHVIINFSGNDFFDSNLCSPFGSLIDDLKSRKNKLIMTGLNQEGIDMFQRNGFYIHLDEDYRKPERYYNTTDFKIDYRKFFLVDTAAFQVYIYESIFKHEDFPKMSSAVKKEINRSILEIFNNAHLHGKCKHIHTCGHYHYREKRLSFTISDLGITIRRNVNQYFKSGRSISGIEAIDWAVQEGHTTKNVADNIPGGLGFSLIRDFLKYNNGSLQIVSSDGYWQEKNGVITSKSLDTRFLGTIVNLNFNLDDPNLYVLTHETKDPSTFL